MPSTCGCFAFKEGRPRANAHIVDTLITAGMIIIGKANLSVRIATQQVLTAAAFIHTKKQELGNGKGFSLTAGWSAVGGQTQTPYVKGGLAPNATWFSHSGPAGSSSGSAVGVAAGFAPIAVGTETDGSIIMPAARAGLYAMKPTPESVDTTGIQPGGPGFDCIGPLAKTTSDVATLVAIMQGYDPEKYFPLRRSWEGIKLGFIDPTLWRVPKEALEVVESFLEQTDNAMYDAQTKIQSRGGKVVKSVPLAPWDDIVGAMPELKTMEELFPCQTKRLFPEFLSLFEGENVPRTLEGLIEYNNAHADIEFNERNDNQKILEISRDSTTTQEEYHRNLKALREKEAGNILDLFKEYDVEAILGPCDSRFGSVAAAAGFPAVNLPLGFADFNGRAFSLRATAPDEETLLQIMSAWEDRFPENVRPPPQMVEQEQE